MDVRLPALMFLILGASPAVATVGAGLPASALIEGCRQFARDPESSSGKLCNAYIRGFLDALRATGHIRAAAEISEETFAERAARTRLGWSRQRPEFCIADDMSMSSFIDHLIHYAQAGDTGELAADQLLGRLLDAAYRCGA
jgi:hypothetical protein